MLRTLIVDDEPLARQVLIEEINHLPEVSFVGEARNGEQALQQIESLRPDLVFLDVQMPKMNGFEVLEKLAGPLPPAIIFVTAYDAYALKAFEVGAADYLLKPVGSERLKTAVERAKRLCKAPRPSAEKLARVINAYQGAIPGQTDGGVRKIVGRKGRDFYLLNPEEILALQADGEIVWIHTGKNRYMATATLGQLEDRLRGTQFCRVHRSSLVNLNHVRKMTSLTSQRWLLTLSDGLEITVSKRQAHLIRDVLQH